VKAMENARRTSFGRRLWRALGSPRASTERIWNHLVERVVTKTYVAAPGNRSESDDGLYVRFVERATREPALFSSFKQNRHYQRILEHLSRADGAAYLEIIKREAPDLVDNIEAFKINDAIGNPTTYDYDRVGRVSPTTLRYIKVASDLRSLFGNLNGAKIAEIGVGYGGQMLVLDRMYTLAQYSMFDLAPVLTLVSKYLEAHVLNAAYRTRTLNQSDGSEAYDLVISNYAFSELPSLVQRKYIEKVMSKARRGYLTMNSGATTSLFAKDHLLIEDLRGLLPPFELLEEHPLTAEGNFILVWGKN
jgi:putative sugar O-methyltransferase